jgi:two-component system response regulator YesN
MSDLTWDERIDQVTSHIQENIGEIDTAEEVAAVVEVSYETLRKRFRREQGMPLGKYIRQARIEEARRLLIETDDPVYVVCRKVGYSSDSNGIRAFKQCTGMTMRAYRRNYGGA